RQEQLQPPVPPVLDQLWQIRATDRAEDLDPPLEVGQPPIVRIDETVVPHLRALVDVRHAWRSQLQDLLRKRIQQPGVELRIDKRLEVIQELRRALAVHHAGDIVLERLFVPLVRAYPVREPGRLARELD